MVGSLYLIFIAILIFNRLMNLIVYHTSTTPRRGQVHFPQLKRLDISSNNLDCNCSLQSLFLSLSTTVKHFRNINITCNEKEKVHAENPHSSSYYINFVGPSGRHTDGTEVVLFRLIAFEKFILSFPTFMPIYIT